MGNGASTSNSKPPGITQLNDTVWELHNPGSIPGLEIIFFHGLQRGDYENALWKTWQARADDNVVWPKDWLPEVFPNARILSISYDSSVTKSPEQLDMFRLGENLVADIIMDGHGIGQFCPVVLVGHSFGGIVIKQFILSAGKAKPKKSHSDIQKTNKFLENFKGVFYYATPHGGSQTAYFTNYIPGNSRYLKLLRTLDKDLARINHDFRIARENSEIRAYTVAEGKPSTYRGIRAFVVEEGSARQDIDTFYTAVNANHFEVCKPENMTSDGIFLKLTGFISDAISSWNHLQANKEKRSFGNFQRLPKGTVGLDLPVKAVQEKLKENAMVGIVGMGGIGKTTFAKELFNKLSPTFEYSCFVLDTKLITGTTEAVKKEVWKCMHLRGERVADQPNGQLELGGQRLLLVLDDVAKDRDLEVLSDIMDDAAEGSRCIVTSRNRELLNRCDVAIYDIPYLSEEDAKQLFTSHALSSQGVRPHWLEDLVDMVVRKCGGLPLTLEVLGKYLKSKTNHKKIWEQTLEALNRAEAVTDFDERLWAKLRLSYDGLGEKEQAIFLDATTFFSNVRSFYKWTLGDAKAAWSSAHGMEDILWRTLVDMSLVYDVEDDQEIKVHEQLLSVGRKIALESSKDGLSRAWEIEASLNLLRSTDELDGKQIHSLQLGVYGRRLFHNIPRRCLGRLKKLQYLHVDPDIRLTIDGAEENETLPTDNLILLRCEGLQFGQLLLDPARLPRLAMLILSLDEHVDHLPSSFGRLGTLRILTIENTSQLEILPDEIGHLARLERLKFLRCQSLRTLPATLGRLFNLEHLHFELCQNLEALPDSLGQLFALTHLSFKSCKKLHSLPQSFGQLQALQHLSFRECKNLRTLPGSFGRLSSLEHLSFDECNNLRTLPGSFGRLSSLEHLSFVQCNTLESLPESFCGLSALKHLSFDGCHNLQDFPSPESFSQLSKLEFLKLRMCAGIESLPFCTGHLPVSLRRLSIGFIPLTRIPDWVMSCPSLQDLELDVLPDLNELPAWLGGSPHEMSRVKTFHVRDGKFTLQQDEESSNWNHTRMMTWWIHKKVMVKVERLDHVGALADLGRVNLEILEPRLSAFILLERGIIKRLMGNLSGALEDVTVAFKKYNVGDTDDDKNGRYKCLMHTGFIRYLLGDETGARELAQAVLELQLEFIPKSLYIREVDSISFGGLPVPNLGEQGVAYLNFRLGGSLEMMEMGELMSWSHHQVMKKVRASDFDGALGALDGVNPQMLGSDNRRIFFQERGILKRLTGENLGALADLTHALEIDFKYGRDNAFCRKHRGLVKYLLGDFDGARTDAKLALAMWKSVFRSRQETIEVAPGHRAYLAFDPVTFLEFTLI